MPIGITLERPIHNVDRKVNVIFFNSDHFRQLGEIHTLLLLLYTRKCKAATSSRQQRATFCRCFTFFMKMLLAVVQCSSMFLRVPVAGNLLLIASFHGIKKQIWPDDSNIYWEKQTYLRCMLVARNKCRFEIRTKSNYFFALVTSRWTKCFCESIFVGYCLEHAATTGKEKCFVVDSAKTQL